MKLKVLSLFLIFTLLGVSTVSASAAITPTKDQVTTVLAGYDLQGQNNSYELACEIGQYVSEKYEWNCDIRKLTFSNHTDVYIDVFYPASDNERGYRAYYGWFGPQHKEVWGFNGGTMYYCDWGITKNTGCRINGVCSWGIVKSFWGNTTEPSNQTVNNTTASTTTQILSVTNETVVRVAENNTMYPVTEAQANNNSVNLNNSTNAGVIVGGNWIQNFMINAQNFYLTITGK